MNPSLSLIPTLLLATGLGLFSLGCEDTPASAPSSAPAAPPMDAAPAAKSAAEIPVPADYADEVEAEITDENYAGELDAIEEELAE